MNVEEIFNLYLTDRLAKEQRADLESLLRSNPDLRREFMDFVVETGMIVRVGNRLLEAAHDPRLDLEATAETMAHPRFRCWPRLILKAAAVLLVMAGGWQSVRIFRSVAVLQEVSGEVGLSYGNHSERAVAGEHLLPDVEITTRGAASSAVIVWKDGSSIKLPAGARLRLTEREGQKLVELQEGYFEANFEKQSVGRPALLISPFIKAEILGTVVRMDAKPENTKLAVVEGKVRVRREVDGRAAQVTSREEVSAGNEAADLRIRRFYWADRFLGGSSGDKGAISIHGAENPNSKPAKPAQGGGPGGRAP